MTRETIGTISKIPETLRRHLRVELDPGSIEATTKVAQSLFRMATEGHNAAAAIFWMKARAGWREKHEVRIAVDDVDHMSGAESEALIRRYGNERPVIDQDQQNGGG
jgi:hypothetical protein